MGIWQAVTTKDTGKRIIDYTPSRSKDSFQQSAPVEKGNKFEVLTQYMEESESAPIQVAPTATSYARLMCPEASSSLRLADAQEDSREYITRLASVDDTEDCEIDGAADVEPDAEDGSAARGSLLSSRQRKREAKRKFNGSRPKGRHRS